MDGWVGECADKWMGGCEFVQIDGWVGRYVSKTNSN